MKLKRLNFPNTKIKISSNEGKLVVFDIIRKKNVLFTPEEWVRQNLIHYLIESLLYPKSLIAVEKQIIYGERKKRFDVLVYDAIGNPSLLIECKSSSTNMNIDTINQLAIYNAKVKCRNFLVTNGLNHFYYFIENNKIHANSVIPLFKDLV